SAEVLIADRMLGSTLHFSGDQMAARHHLEIMLSSYVPPIHARMLYQFDQRIAARALLARICWLQGFPDQATSLAAAAVESALAMDHEGAVCFALAEAACPIALFTRNFELAKRLISQLLDRSVRYGLIPWEIYGQGYEAELLIRCGDPAIGLTRLRS